MAVSSFMVPLGTPAPDFSLPDLDGALVTLDDFSEPALLIAFLCNHCPYVQHVEKLFGELVSGVPGLATVGICSNDTARYPDDDLEGLEEQARRAGWGFPYLIDESQEVARAYQAACTPDFFLYDAERRLAYRGAMDESTPGNDRPHDGHLLGAAISLVLAGQPIPEPHIPSMGCSIKYRE
jgi:peroxiredoxin